MKNATLLALVAVVWIFGALGCGGAVDSDRTSKLTFLWIPKEDFKKNPVFKPGTNGAEAKAQELSNNGDFEVVVTYKVPVSPADIEGQAEMVRSAKKGGISGVAVSCNSADGLKEAIDEVVDAGIPVMTFDSDSPNSKRFTYLAGDNRKAGALAANILNRAMMNNTKRKVALVSGVQGAQNLKERVDGFLAAITENHYDLDPIGEIAYCNDDEVQAAAFVEDIMLKNPDLGGFFFVGMWALHGCHGTDCSQNMPLWNQAAANGTVKTVAFDTLEFELGFVKNGMVAGLVGQRCWGWGSDSVQMLYDRVVNHKQFALWTDTGLDVVCPNNVSEMEAMWKFERLTPQLSDCVIDGVTIN